MIVGCITVTILTIIGVVLYLKLMPEYLLRQYTSDMIVMQAEKNELFCKWYARTPLLTSPDRKVNYLKFRKAGRTLTFYYKESTCILRAVDTEKAIIVDNDFDWDLFPIYMEWFDSCPIPLADYEKVRETISQIPPAKARWSSHDHSYS
jgi:hypothetical protein